jgi:predicted TPR repeat methyltransferase
MDRFLARELEIIAEMPRYYDWITDMIRPYVGGRVVEIGAGLGSMSERLLPLSDDLSLVEPSAYFASVLEQRFGGRTDVSLHNTSVESYLEANPRGGCNTIVMVNVLEHIEADAAVLGGVSELLEKGGTLVIFVPALPFLYSKLDEAVGHYRRYRREDLSALLGTAGFEVLDIRYMDILGILPWWLVMTLMGNTTFNPRQVRLYDAVGVPVTRVIEGLFKPWIGKNILAVAERR